MRKSVKRTLSLVLAGLMLSSVATAATVSVSANNGEKYMHTLEKALEYFESDMGGEKIPTTTYYFYMPEDWKNEYNDYYDASVGLDSCVAGVYWYGSETALPSDYLPFYSKNEWPGYALVNQDAPNVFVAKVPADVITIVFNNTVDGGMDKTKPEYLASYQIVDTPTTGHIGSDDYGFYPNGIPEDPGNANMIYVVDPEATEVSELTGKTAFKGSWFYYYGNGEYGTAPTKEEAGDFVFKNGEFPSTNLVAKPEEINVGTGGTGTISVNKTPCTAVSDNTDIATVAANEDGTFTVTAVAKGEATITVTYTDSETQETETDTVAVNVGDLSFITPSLEMEVGGIDFLLANGLGENAVWSSSNPAVVDVDQSGVVTALSAGKADIIITQGSTVVKCPVTVASSTSINKESAKLAAGKTLKLKVEGATGTIKWKSSDTKVATVDKKGTVTALTKGSAKITATVDGQKFTCKVTVTSDPKLASKKVTVKKGAKVVVKVTGAASKPVVTPACKVAKVKVAKGKLTITGTKAGSQKLTVKVNGKNIKLTVKVK